MPKRNEGEQLGKFSYKKWSKCNFLQLVGITPSTVIKTDFAFARPKQKKNEIEQKISHSSNQ